ncbi:MAG: class I SAM-dependent methyltransferase [Candidatus Thiodiazotropha sp.]
MSSNHSVRDYNKYVKRMRLWKKRSKAMAVSIGGNFIPFGQIMRDLLLQYGLQPDSSLVDIGCGSGRLANALKEMPELHYMGFDVVSSLVEYAEQICDRKDWKFFTATDFRIPSPDESVDLVTAFSVFTHLRHEETFLYLVEASRVLKPGGKIIFSFLDFSVPPHWSVFESNIRNVHDADMPLNQFMDKQAISTWCQHLPLKVLEILPGDTKGIRLRQPITLEDGTIEKEYATLGQSVCVLVKGDAAVDQELDTLLDGFDGESYLQANPDVAQSGMDPREHYLKFGRFEGRKLKP